MHEFDAKSELTRLMKEIDVSLLSIKVMFDSAKQQNLSDKYYSIQMSMTNSAISSNRLPKLKPSANNVSNNFKTNQGVFKSLNAAIDLFLRKSCSEK